MNINTGRYVELKPGMSLPNSADWVQVEGTPEQVEELSRRVRLGAAVLEKRKVRRAQQRASRRRNR